MNFVHRNAEFKKKKKCVFSYVNLKYCITDKLISLPSHNIYFFYLYVLFHEH